MAERLETDLLIVGAGPASLATAYRFLELAKGKGFSPQVAVIEKTREVGDAILSGAVMDPRGIEELIPDWRSQGAPVRCEVEEDAAYFLTKGRAVRLPVTPPPLKQEGNSILSLSEFTRWMGKVVEGMGANIFTGFAGRELLYEGDRVVGVQTGDKGLNKKGGRKSNFEPGVEIRAKLTILGEGVRGNLTRDHIKRLGLDNGRNPPSFGTGVKEVWEIPAGRFPKGTVYHTMGFPLMKGGMGGGWLYGMEENLLSLGYVVWLAYQDPLMDPHERFQLFKTHPMIRKILEGGKMVQYGAKAVSVGGYYSIPKMYSDGCLLVGESANLVDGMKLKGIHLAIGSGKLAGEVAFEALQKGDFSSGLLKRYGERFERSWMKKELWQSRNFHQSFDGGFLKGMIRTGLQTILRGRDLRGSRLPAVSDVRHMEKVQEYYGSPKKGPDKLKYDNRFLFDKLTDVYHSGTIHEEDQPSHLIVPDTKLCVERCSKEYGNPCTRFCPAEVYEMEGEGKERHLKLNPSNCVHCKTCDIMDPYDNIRWVPPEGGGGPRYTIL